MAGEETTIGVIGLGLVGGSAALRLREQKFAATVIGYDKNESHAQEALALGIIDDTCSLESLCDKADLIILAIPVNSALTVLRNVIVNIKPSAVVVDFGSTKQKICELADTLPNRDQFVACQVG